MSRPLVSVLLPVRNVSATLRPALQSVLRQELSDLELLVLDDGSTDDTVRLCRELSDGDPRVRIIVDGQSRGLPTRLNQGLALATGPLVARMDGDDVCYPQRLRLQVAVLEQEPRLDLVGASVAVFGEGGALRGVRMVPPDHDAICRRPFAGFPLAHPTYVGRRTWFQRHGYDIRAVRCEDQDLLLRSYRESRFANVTDILLGYREDGVDLRKTARGRRHFVAAAMRQAHQQGQLTQAPRAALAHGARAAAEAVAVVTGTEARLLRHRARPADAAHAQDWERVWAWATAP